MSAHKLLKAVKPPVVLFNIYAGGNAALHGLLRKHTEGDGYLYQNRSLSDVFVFPNGKDGTVDSVFVDVDTAEFGG